MHSLTSLTKCVTYQEVIFSHDKNDRRKIFPKKRITFLKNGDSQTYLTFLINFAVDGFNLP